MNQGYRSLCDFLTRNCNKTRKTGYILYYKMQYNQILLLNNQSFQEKKLQSFSMYIYLISLSFLKFQNLFQKKLVAYAQTLTLLKFVYLHYQQTPVICCLICSAAFSFSYISSNHFSLFSKHSILVFEEPIQLFII